MSRVAVAALFLTLWTSSSATTDHKPQTKDILSRCVATLGGADRLQNVRLLTYQSWSHTFLHSISPSESLPGLFAYETKDVVLQLQRQIISEKSRWQWTESETPNISSLLITPEGGFIERNGAKTPVSADRFYGSIDALAANPISALLAASASADAHLLPQPGEMYEVAFLQTIYGQRIETTLGIDKHSYVLRSIEIRHSYSQDIYNAMWGDIVKRFVYSSWYLDPSGVYLPTKWRVSTNGLDDGQVSLVNVKINPILSEPLPDLPSDFKNSFDAFLHLSAHDFARRNLGNGDHVDVQEGIVMLPGRERTYNALVVKQDQGIVVVEGPYSNANSEQIIQYANSAFPATPIVAVVSTDQLWFHVAGLPAYAKAHIPIYVLDANADLVRWVLSSQLHGVDAHRSASQVRIVKGRTRIGTGKNQIVLIPFRGAASARMIAVYFPQSKLLYCSDLYLPLAWGHQYWTERLAEIRDLIEREHLDVQQIAGESVPPHAWKDLVGSVPAK
jgi:hypothetical protein